MSWLVSGGDGVYTAARGCVESQVGRCLDFRLAGAAQRTDGSLPTSERICRAKFAVSGESSVFDVSFC